MQTKFWKCKFLNTVLTKLCRSGKIDTGTSDTRVTYVTLLLDKFGAALVLFRVTQEKLILVTFYYKLLG